MGTFMILDHIARARRQGLPYVYLGYWIDGSKKMDYKARFLPQQRLAPSGWLRIDAEGDAGVRAAGLTDPSAKAETRVDEEESLSSHTYNLIARAIIERLQVLCSYQGYPRALCPALLGHTNGEEHTLAFQFAGDA